VSEPGATEAPRDVASDVPHDARLQRALLEHARDPLCGWSVGAWGAVAEFVRSPGEPAEVEAGPGRLQVRTAGGALRVALRADVRALAWERPTRRPGGWSVTLALCLCEHRARIAGDAAAIAQIRVALRQLASIGPGAPALAAWRARFEDPGGP